MKVDDKFIQKISGKEFILYAGLVDLGHQAGMESIEVDLLQVPSADNDMTAIVKARVKTKEKVFEDIGDAGPKSVGNMIKPHIIRMASTRAKARALRDLTNVGMTALEELGGEENDKPNDYKAKTDKGKGKLSQAQINRLYAIAGSKGIDGNTVDAQVKTKLKKNVQDMARAEYDRVVKGYESMKGEK